MFGWKVGGIEQRGVPDSTLGGKQIFPQLGNGRSQGSNTTDTGDDDATSHDRLLEMVGWVSGLARLTRPPAHQLNYLLVTPSSSG